MKDEIRKSSQIMPLNLINYYLSCLFSKNTVNFRLIDTINIDVSLHPYTNERRKFGVWNKQQRKT